MGEPFYIISSKVETFLLTKQLKQFDRTLKYNNLDILNLRGSTRPKWELVRKFYIPGSEIVSQEKPEY